DQNGNVEEVNHYYPFGGIFANTASIQSYKYNGKELDTKNGLNWYDYGARHYDAAIGRWQVVDPMAEKYYSNSPYTYCANNPMRFIDPTGMFYGDYYSGYTGKFLFSDGIKDNKVYVRNVTSIVGNELIYEDTQVGTKNNIPDKTNVFNAFLKKTNDYFTEMNQNLEKKESRILMGGIGKYKRKLAAFRELVTDEAPFDIKNAEGGEFSTKNKKAFKNKYAFYDGKL
ncbi:RHS repeat-associated core domain-containing protein, partial [Bacteroides bouchesdurhonensis]